jgi:hypothetical protein
MVVFNINWVKIYIWVGYCTPILLVLSPKKKEIISS